MSREGLTDTLSARGIIVDSLIYSQSLVSVYRGRYQNYACAIKVQYSTNSESFFVLEKEFKIMQKVSHNNALKLYDCLWAYQGTSQFLIFVTEWCAKDMRKDIDQRRQNTFPFSEAEVWDTVKTLVGFFAYLQRNNIAHRDIKPANIFYGINRDLMVGDFGSATEEVEDWSGIVGTPGYMSPKLFAGLNDRHRTPFVHNAFKSDVFSLGVTVFEMISLQLPGLFVSSVLAQGTADYLINSLQCSENMKQLLRAMLAIDEDNRGDFLEFDEWLNPKVPSPIAFSIPREREIQHPMPLKVDSSAAKDPQVEVVNSPVIVPVEAEIESVNPSAVVPQLPPVLEEQKAPICLHCKSNVDVFGENAKFEVVQLECDPQHHMFCSRNCFRRWERLQRKRTALCPMCKSPVSETLFDIYKETDKGQPLLSPKEDHKKISDSGFRHVSEQQQTSMKPRREEYEGISMKRQKAHTEVNDDRSRQVNVTEVSEPQTSRMSKRREYGEISMERQLEVEQQNPQLPIDRWRTRLNRFFANCCCRNFSLF